jgi:hypothetical protein
MYGFCCPPPLPEGKKLVIPIHFVCGLEQPVWSFVVPMKLLVMVIPLGGVGGWDIPCESCGH